MDTGPALGITPHARRGEPSLFILLPPVSQTCRNIAPHRKAFFTAAGNPGMHIGQFLFEIAEVVDDDLPVLGDLVYLLAHLAKSPGNRSGGLTVASFRLPQPAPQPLTQRLALFNHRNTVGINRPGQ